MNQKFGFPDLFAEIQGRGHSPTDGLTLIRSHRDVQNTGLLVVLEGDFSFLFDGLRSVVDSLEFSRVFEWLGIGPASKPKPMN